MTNITGKIYQMKNAAGTENRFPRTVIEAVLGLSSYLQNQFSSLANLYMPIEGIHESKTGQEFVYRATPNTIKANQLEVQKIKGKTLAWNQLANPISNSPWSSTGATNPDGSITITPNTVGNKYGVLNANLNTVIQANPSHIYLITAYVRSNSPGSLILGKVSYAGGGQLGFKAEVAVGDGNWKQMAVVTSATASSSYTFGLISKDGAIPSTFDYKDIQVFDLTQMFGAGNEPSSVGEFEALYPDAYYHYNPGTLISNDAEAVETTGANQWDEEWELGKIYALNGQNLVDSNAIRTKGYIPIFPNTSYYARSSSAVVCYRRFYDADKNYLGESTVIETNINAVFTTPAGAYYMRFYMAEAYGATYNHDICINLSNAAINGQYFPYWKRTLQLGITTRKDTDGNVPFADGMKGAGTAADWADKVGGEIVMGEVDLGSLGWVKVNTANSYRFEAALNNVKRTAASNIPGNAICDKYATIKADYTWTGAATGIAISNSEDKVLVYDTSYSDASAFKTAMDGVKLIFEKAAPVPFTWAEPLVTSMRAGTTEARISPNQDGLSAPFCGDLYYSVVLDSSVEDASYAYSAGKLLNSHKIWGQDFNGTQDVTGNLTSNGVITGTQLVSTITNAAPLTVASSVLVNNLNVEKVGGKTLTEILASNVASATRLQDNTSHTAWGRTFWSNGVPQNISGALENVTTINASGLATLSGGIALGTSTNAQAAKMVWSEANNAWHLQGNLYVDGYITAGAANQ